MLHQLRHVEPEILCIIAKSWREHVMLSRQMGLMQLTDTLVSHKYLKFHFLLKFKWVKKKTLKKTCFGRLSVLRPRAFSVLIYITVAERNVHNV